MNINNLVAKGKYSYPRDERLPYVTEYLILKENGKNFLLLRFFNPRKETVNRIRFKLEQFNSEGKSLSVKYFTLDKLNGAEGMFVPANKMGIASDCVDVKVTVLTAGYGSYNYSIAGGDLLVEYVDSSEDEADLTAIKSKLGKYNRTIRHRKLGFSIIICLCSIFLLVCITLGAYFHLSYFKSSEESFSLNKVEYIFINSTADNAALAVSGYSGNQEEVAIPAEIEGYKVEQIAAYAFRDNSKLKKITFEDEIAIDKYAFINCENLTEVDFSKVSSIDVGAFQNCKSLTTLASERVEYIGASAFYNCTALQLILLTGASDFSVTIGRNAFYGCTRLDKIVIERTVEYESSFNIFTNCENVTYLKLHKLGKFGGSNPQFTQLFGTSELQLKLQKIILNELDEISYGMCRGLSQLTDLTIYTCRSSTINSYAFADCINLNGLHLYTPITSVGQYAFCNCGIESFDFSSVKILSIGAFKDCKNLTSIDSIIESSVTVIPYEAFSGCMKLESVALPETVEMISALAFSNCLSLTKMSLPKSILAITDGAFWVDTIYYAGSQAEWIKLMGGNAYKFSSEVVYNN